MIIRLENENDYFDVENLVRNAFWNIYRPGAYEHYIVHNLRDDESFIADLAYVIEENGKIIAHINYSKGKIDINGGDLLDAVVLGPVSVDIEYQNQGYGTKLIEYTLELVKKDFPYVFVVGDENYYSRFGFESASKYDLYLNGTDTNDECPFFMIKIFSNEADINGGIFSNPEVFDVRQGDVDEFDRQFEYRKKEIREGQLVI